MSKNDQKTIPSGAWDTHHHIFEPHKFGLAEGRHFTPATASLEDLVAFEKSLGIDHVCIAHGLSYGADCTSLLHYLDYFQGKARGICVLDIATVTDETLDNYHAAGVRSVRLDFFKERAMDSVERQVQLIDETAKRLLRWGKHKWSIQIQQPHLDYWHVLGPFIDRLQLPVVVDHIALYQAPSMLENGATQVDRDGFGELLNSLRHGNLWIKISAPYRCSDIFHTYDDLEEPVRAIVGANKHRMVWGSDWPHTQRHKDRVGRSSLAKESFLQIDDQAWVQSLSRWLSSEDWQLMWVDNPRELYK